MTASCEHTRFRRLLVLGALVMAAGCIAVGYSAADAATQQERSGQLISSLREQLDATVPDDSGESANAADLSALNLEGVDVVGRLQAPGISLDVPVAAKNGDIRLTPALVDGRDGELLVQGSSYQDAIGAIGQLKQGAAVTFTQVDGTVRRYEVADTGELQGEFNDNFDLLVYYQDEFGTKHWAGCRSTSQASAQLD